MDVEGRQLRIDRYAVRDAGALPRLDADWSDNPAMLNAPLKTEPKN
jgi:hypothetical protein